MSTSRIDNLGMGITVETIAFSCDVKATFSIDGLAVGVVELVAGGPVASLNKRYIASKDYLMKLAAVSLYMADRLQQIQTRIATDSVSVVGGEQR